MSESLRTPFDVTSADSQLPGGMFGQSPDFWRQIAMFGANLAQSANARTPSGHLANGTGLAGPLGAATVATAKQADEVAKLRSQLGVEGAQTALLREQVPLTRARTRHVDAETGLVTAQTGKTRAEVGKVGAETALLGSQRTGVEQENKIRGYGMPFQEEQAAQRLRLLRQGPPGQQGAQGQPGDYSDRVMRAESGGSSPAAVPPNPFWPVSRGGPVGPAQFSKATREDFARANPQYFPPNPTPDQIAAAFSQGDPARVLRLNKIATDWYGRQNAPLLRRAGIEPNAANLSFTHWAGPGRAVQLLRFPDNTPLAQALYATEPKTAQAVLDANPPYANLTIGQIKYKRTGIPGVAGPRISPQADVGLERPPPPPSIFASLMGGGETPAPVQAPPAQAQPPANAGQPMGAPRVIVGSRMGGGETPAPVQAPPAQAQPSAQMGQPMGAPVQAGPGQAVGAPPQGSPGTGPRQQGGPVQVPPGLLQPAQVPAGTIPGSEQARALAQQYRDEVKYYTELLDYNKRIGGGMFDEQHLRQMAQDRMTKAMDLEAAGPRARAVAAAEAPYKFHQGRGGEVLQAGPDGIPRYIGTPPKQERVYNPQTGNEEYRYVPGHGAFASPSDSQGAPIAKPGPQTQEAQEFGPQTRRALFEADKKRVEDSLAHVIEQTAPGKVQLLQLRSLVPQAATGASGELRAQIRNWLQTYLPSGVSQFTGDASPAQELQKFALMGSAAQEQQALGARSGFRALEIFMKANPSLDMQPDANIRMANALLIFRQQHEDYASGATHHFNNQLRTVQGGSHYQPLSAYDQAYNSTFRPELYAAAINAMNGVNSAEWGRNLTPKQRQIVGGIVSRADPNATLNIDGKRVPVTDFSRVMTPMDIMPGGDGGR